MLVASLMAVAVANLGYGTLSFFHGAAAHQQIASIEQRSERGRVPVVQLHSVLLLTPTTHQRSPVVSNHRLTYTLERGECRGALRRGEECRACAGRDKSGERCASLSLRSLKIWGRNRLHRYDALENLYPGRSSSVTAAPPTRCRRSSTATFLPACPHAHDCIQSWLPHV
jgi:hypothetical protein